MKGRARRTFLGLQKWLSEEWMGQSGVAGGPQIKAAKHLGCHHPCASVSPSGLREEHSQDPALSHAVSKSGLAEQ